MNFENKVVVITGASRGIGKATAIKFAKNGAKVTLGYNSYKKGVEETALEIKKFNGEYIFCKIDVSKMSDAKKLMEKTVDNFSKIDILINNAGITDPKQFNETSEEDWDKMIDINLKGVFNCCKQAVPFMLKQDTARIINISSILGLTGGIGAGVHYCAAKAGVIGLSKALANQLSSNNITVNTVAPGMIDTRMIQWRSDKQMKAHTNKIPLKRVGKPEEIAQAICYLASKEAGFITGETLNINGGMYMS